MVIETDKSMRIYFPTSSVANFLSKVISVNHLSFKCFSFELPHDHGRIYKDLQSQKMELSDVDSSKES